jgi:hypothetical protein
MSIDIKSIVYILVFLVPGFIIESIIRFAKPQIKRDNTFTLLYMIVLSTINYLLSIWYLQFLYTYYIQGQYNKIILPCLSIILIEPIFIGLICILLEGPIDSLLKKIFGTRANANIPSAWDYKFTRLKVGRYVAVKLKNNDIVYGLYNKSSFASTADAKCDLYLQQQFDIDPNGQLHIIDNTDGVYISGDQIVSIEFYVGGDKK